MLLFQEAEGALTWNWEPDHPSFHLPLKGGLIGLQLRAAFSTAHPLARQDVPFTQARAFQLWLPLL